MSPSTADEMYIENSIPKKITESLNSYVTDDNLAVAVDIRLPGFNFNADINGSDLFPAASVLKLPLAIAIEQKSRLSGLDLKCRHDVAQIIATSQRHSVLRGLVHTQDISTEELLRLLLIASDEPSSIYLRTLISTEEVNSFLSKTGFSNTSLSSEIGEVSVSGVTTALEALQLIS